MPDDLITFHEARQIVALRLAGRPLQNGGHRYVAPDGFETIDDRWWIVRTGAVEWLIGGDRSFAEWDVPAFYVSKATGEIDERSVIDSPDVLDPRYLDAVSDPEPL